MTAGPAGPASPARHAHVALPLPLATPYTYRIPESLGDRVEPGARVVVPVRARELVGIVTAVDVDPLAATARDILAVPDPAPALLPPLLETARWMAGYYGAPLGIALRAMLPAGLWGASQVAVRVVDASRAPGGLAGDVLRWLDRRGGEALVPAVARGLKRPVWDVMERLARVGAVALDVVPPDTGGEAVVERWVHLAGESLTLVDRDRLFGRARRQREVYELLEQLGGSAPARLLRERLGVSDGVVDALVQRGLALRTDEERVRDPFAGFAGTPPVGELTLPQAAAVEAIGALPPGDGTVLFGVTGSGKTRVYLEAMRRVLEAGGGAIILVPEIALTPQTVGRLRGAFGDAVAVLHSGLSDGERADAWRLLRRGERRVAVGARSAVFAPVERLGIVVLDEEHEATYKNGEAPRYQARDVAAVRARLEGARLVLGSATPSLETMARAAAPATAARPLALVRLPQRIGALPLPAVELVDLRTAPRVPGTGALPWSERLDQLLAATLGRQEQALLLLNRRGYAAFVQCPSCGDVPTCPRCSISLTVHRAPASLRCHYCGHAEPPREACAACGHAVQAIRGVGTQQLERLLAERFPTARLARMDLDTTGARWAHHRILDAFGRAEVDILLGTQMIAKGLDFPGVTLVGVVDADTGLHLPDFRAAERTFQLLAQVAGRAGRGPKGGRVVVQTRAPEHHALVRAAAHDTEGFVADEMALRATPAYPPHVALVNLVASGLEEQATSGAAAAVADWCSALAERHGLPLDVLGPAPCPVARLKDRWRWHVLLKGAPAVLGRVVRYAARRLPRPPGVRVVIDRDPASLM